MMFRKFMRWITGRENCDDCGASIARCDVAWEIDGRTVCRKCCLEDFLRVSRRLKWEHAMNRGQ